VRTATGMSAEARIIPMADAYLRAYNRSDF